MFPKILINRVIVLKLLHDALFVLVVLFFGFLLMESVLPGLISGHFGLGIITGLILITLGLINYFSEKLAAVNSAIEFKTSTPPLPIYWCGGKKEVFILLFIFFIFIFNSVLRIDWLLGAIISLLASLAGFLVFFLVQKAD